MKDHRTRTDSFDVKQAGPAFSPRTRKRLSREERAAGARQAIFAAASKVVGQYGYADASITRITEAAGIAQGTFYLYFASRQALFDELLPHVGQDILHFLHDHVAGAKDIYDVEERGFRAFFHYLKENPGFFRILNEAEIAAPVAYSKHFKVMTDRYVESLERARNAGHIKRFDRDELETLAYIFMAARSYLYLRYIKGKSTARPLPEKAIQTYMKLVRDGLK